MDTAKTTNLPATLNSPTTRPTSGTQTIADGQTTAAKSEIAGEYTRTESEVLQLFGNRQVF